MRKKVENISDKLGMLHEGVDWFYGEDFRLEEASERYKELANLAKEIEKDLTEMKNEIKVIAEDFGRDE